MSLTDILIHKQLCLTNSVIVSWEFFNQVPMKGFWILPFIARWWHCTLQWWCCGCINIMAFFLHNSVVKVKFTLQPWVVTQSCKMLSGDVGVWYRGSEYLGLANCSTTSLEQARAAWWTILTCWPCIKFISKIRERSSCLQSLQTYVALNFLLWQVTLKWYQSPVCWTAPLCNSMSYKNCWGLVQCLKVNLFAIVNNLPFYLGNKKAILILIRNNFVALKPVSYT